MQGNFASSDFLPYSANICKVDQCLLGSYKLRTFTVNLMAYFSLASTSCLDRTSKVTDHNNQFYQINLMLAHALILDHEKALPSAALALVGHKLQPLSGLRLLLNIDMV